MTSKHDRHDRVLVARYAAGDAYPSEIDQAQRLVDGCAECAALAGDIRLISARTADLPPIRRNRDFRLTPEQAHKLSGSWLERVMRGLSAPGWTVVRPLAGAALAVGIVLAGIGALPTSFGAGSTTSDAIPPAAGLPTRPSSTQAGVANAPPPQPTDVQFDASGSSAPHGSGAASGARPTAAASTGGALVSAPGQSPVTPESAASALNAPTPRDAETPTTPKANETPAPTPATQALVGVISSAAPSAAPPQAPAARPAGNAFASTETHSTLDHSALLVLGLGLALASVLALAVVWIARRRYSDPLVR